MGNWFAYFVLLIWPLISVRLYRIYSIQLATVLTLLIGFMFLPVKTIIDFPMIPALNKDSISILATLFGCRFIAKQKIYLLGKSKLKWLLVVYIFTPFATAMNNGDAFFVGERFLPGMTYYDAFSESIVRLIGIIPFCLGYQFFRDFESHIVVFKTILMAGLFYSLLILIELRLSPQLHYWVYGYFPHQFIQMVRSGGYRPVVFMGHGLTVSIFMAVAFISSVLFLILKKKIGRFSVTGVVCYLLVILIACKSFASIIYTFLFILLIKVMKIKIQFRFAKIIVLLFMLYPVVSILDWFPHQKLVDWAENISPDRAHSLKYRFDNEFRLLEHANKRVFFGWGTWGRNRLYNEESGEDLSTTDGSWIITLGMFGLVGYVSKFGLLSIPIFRSAAVYKLVKSKSELVLLVTQSLLLSFILLDQLPNSSLNPWMMLMYGMLLGRTEEIVLMYKRQIKIKKYNS